MQINCWTSLFVRSKSINNTFFTIIYNKTYVFLQSCPERVSWVRSNLFCSDVKVTSLNNKSHILANNRLKVWQLCDVFSLELYLILQFYYKRKLITMCKKQRLKCFLKLLLDMFTFIRFAWRQMSERRLVWFEQIACFHHGFTVRLS